MMNKMIEGAKKSQFNLPVFILPFVAYGIYLIGDLLGGSLAVTLCNSFHPTDDNINRILLLSVAVNALLILLWVKFIEQRDLRNLGFYKGSLIKDTFLGVAVGIAAFSAIVGIGSALQIVKFQSADLSAANVLNVFLMIPFWIIQAGTEELLTRGWILPAVSAKTNKMIGIIVSSLMFVLLHINNAGLNPVAILNIFLIGVLLALYTLKSDNICGAIAFHAFWNFTQGSFFGLSVSGDVGLKPNLMSFVSQGDILLSGGSFGIEASIINTAITALLVAALLLTNKSLFLQSSFWKSKTPPLGKIGK